MGPRAGVMLHPVWGLLGCCFLCSWALGGPRPLRSGPPLSSHVQPGSGPLWVPLEGAEAALAFLYSGDTQQLSGANCSERYEAQGAEASPGLPPVLWRAAGTLAQAANFLNMLLQANDIRESSVEEDVEWYQALVRSVAEGDPRAYRAFLTFDPPPGASHLPLALQATRMGEETLLQDLSGTRVQEESPTRAPDTSALQKRVLTNDLGSLGSPKWPQGDGYVGDMRHVKLSPPFLECQEGRLRPGWLVTLSATFYGLQPDLSPEVQMDIDLQSVDINQCASGPGWYSNTHLCDLNSTQCVPLDSQGFVLGHYLCRCRPGFYGASRSGGMLTVVRVRLGWVEGVSGEKSSGRLLRCQPCAEGCTSCRDARPCLVEEASALRAAVLACQACCMLAVFLSMLLSYRCRRSKRIRTSGVVLLEAILFGSLLLYFPVSLWPESDPTSAAFGSGHDLRVLGSSPASGSLLSREVLQLFLSRSAQRGPHLSNGRLLQRLGLLLLLMLAFLVVWTAGALERGSHAPLVARGHTPAGRHFYLCHHDHWDYIMVVAEVLLLCWGSFLCYATRAVPSAFHEPRYMSIALHNELLLSSAFHAARFLLVPSLHPDWTLLLFFFHTHSTVTTTLALIFIPKFQKPGAPPREEMVDEVYEDELDLQRSGSYLDSSIASAWSERSLDAGDIRDELKKLYAQLEVHKTKEMAANNPHLPKKQGSSRQGLGRSFMRYLAEFPEALARQHSRDSGSPRLGSLPGSSRRRLLSSSFQNPDGTPALRKSHSTYDHERQGYHREQDPPLLDSLLRRKLAKKASRESRESRESVEGPPALGFRSASAHNLTVCERLPRARPTSLQKSLSVVAGSREKALLVASQAYLEETYRQDGKGPPQEEKVRAPGRPEPKAVAVQEKPERADGKQEAVCPWESQDCGELSPQPAPRAFDRRKGSSEAAGSVGAKVAAVGPWEAEAAPSAKEVEICPWEVNKEAAEKGGLGQEVDGKSRGQGEMILQKTASGGTEEHIYKAAAKVSREQETVCPQEGRGLGAPCPQPDTPSTGHPPCSPQGASRARSRMAEVCQWEVTDPEGNKIKGTMADFCDWEGTGVPSEESGLLASTATQKEIFFPTVPENPPCLLVHSPPGSSLPESKSTRPEVSKAGSTFTPEGVRELQGASGHGPRTSSAPEPSHQEAEVQESSSTVDQGEGVSTAPHEELSPPTVYPWDCE
uniref:G protein-coupled receptor 179 n=1 Tax=Neovison vison TaxID=452646 RepID=A0A8C7AFT1_NEOVI